MVAISFETNFKFGTKEWADHNINCISGCSRNCRYCYAKKMAIRFRQKNEETWPNMEIRKKAVDKKYHKRNGRIMFPTSHDIVSEEPYKEACLIVLGKLLNAENNLLITTKPELDVIKDICNRFDKRKKLIQFRFTIGSLHDEIIEFWEPHAPIFTERFECLKFAFNRDFQTSISIEPFLDYDPLPLIKKLLPFVTDTIWVGLMNNIKRKPKDKQERIWYDNIRKYYEFTNIFRIYETLKNHPKIRWKESIKKIIIKNLL